MKLKWFKPEFKLESPKYECKSLSWYKWRFWRSSTWDSQPPGHGLCGGAEDLVFRNQLVHQPHLQGLWGAVEQPELQRHLRGPVAHRVGHGIFEPAEPAVIISWRGVCIFIQDSIVLLLFLPKRCNDAEQRLVQTDGVAGLIRHDPVVAGQSHQTPPCRTGALWKRGGVKRALWAEEEAAPHLHWWLLWWSCRSCTASATSPARPSRTRRSAPDSSRTSRGCPARRRRP